MQVREISLVEFMRFTGDTVLKLPPVGLVLITGQNGAGKSTFVEAVSYAAWGKTLRGTDPRRAGSAGSVRIHTGFGMELVRSWTHSMRTQLEVAHDKAEASWQFDTTSKAQDHVTGVLGEWDTWRRSCAFSSVDDLSFATASDAERKRLLESLIGLSRFDRALEACRVDLRVVSLEVASAKGALVRVQVARTEATQGLEALEVMAAQAAPQADLASLKARLEVVEGNLETREQNFHDEGRAKWAAWITEQEYKAKIKRLEAQIRDLEGDACPTCDQVWPDKDTRDVKRFGLQHDLKELRDNPPRGPDERRYKAAEQALDDCRKAAANLKAELRQAEQAIARHNEAQALVKEAKLRLIDMEDEEDAARTRLESAEYLARHLEVTDTVLGTKGARAHMLADALAGLEGVANLWLERIARVDAPLKLRLSPYTEKKTGGTADAISMEVEGAGGGRGYRAASGGERRRIDVAIMLALAEVAQRADGRVAPTMFFDEVFDSLDVAGVEAVAQALDQLAQDRCVVVMSHSVDLISHLVPDLRIHVVDGRIEHK